MDVDPDDLIYDIKVRIAFLESGIPVHLIRILYNGKLELLNDKTVHYYELDVEAFTGYLIV